MAWTVVTQPNCPSCRAVKEHLDIHDVSYDEFDITEYKNQWIRYLLKQAGYSTVPQVWTHEGQYLGGYEGVQKHDIQTV